jgi:hypothetical protein
MIKFFKKIRQNLLSEGKTRKYFKYAIGEIILVVIGILIALSINNWNANQKDETETLNYLTNLIEALIDDINSFEANISFNKTRLKGIFYILEHSGLNTQTFTEIEWIDVSKNDNENHIWKGSFPVSLNRKFTDLAFSLLGRGFGGISLNKSVINELYSTGSFSNIQNANLKTKMGNYYSFLAQRLEGYAIEEHEEWANETTRFLRDKYSIFTLDVSDLEDPIAPLKGKQDVEHQLRYLALEVNYHCVWEIQAKKMALDLVRLIEEEEHRLKNKI